jgi:two-component system response regulator YesN
MEQFRDVLSAIERVLAAESPSEITNPTIKAVTDYLHRHYADNELSLSQAAAKFHLNKSYLSQLFKQQVGVNFQLYVIGIRIERAKELLRQNEPVQDVCFAVGIDNVSYFSQLFKRKVGVSPTDYAKERQP